MRKSEEDHERHYQAHVTEQVVRVSQLFNTLLFTQKQQEQEVRVNELFNTLLFTQQQQEEEARVSQLFNTLLFTQQQQEEQEVRVSQLFNTHHKRIDNIPSRTIAARKGY